MLKIFMFIIFVLCLYNGFHGAIQPLSNFFAGLIAGIFIVVKITDIY